MQILNYLVKKKMLAFLFQTDLDLVPCILSKQCRNTTVTVFHSVCLFVNKQEYFHVLAHSKKKTIIYTGKT